MVIELEHGLPLIMGPNTADGLDDVTPLMGTSSLSVVKYHIHSKHPDSYPNAGAKLMHDGEVDGLVILGPDTTPEEASGAANSRQYLHPIHQEHQTIITSDAAINELEKEAINRHYIPASELNGMLKDEVFKRYGIDPRLSDTNGSHQLKGIIVQRFIRDRLLGKRHPYTFLYTSGPKATRQPYWLAELFTSNPNLIYSQTAETAEGFGAYLAQALTFEEKGEAGKIIFQATKNNLLPTHRYMVKSWLLDHAPIATGAYTQNLVMMIAASEFAQATGFSAAQVVDAATIRNGYMENKEEMAKDYKALLDVIGEVCTTENIRLIDATPQHYQRMNALIKSRYADRADKIGQIGPSLYTLVKEKMIDLDRVSEIEKGFFNRKWYGLPYQDHRFIDEPNLLERVLPINRKNPQSNDNQRALAEEFLERAQEDDLMGMLEVPDNYSNVTSLSDGVRTRALEHLELTYAQRTENAFKDVAKDHAWTNFYNVDNLFPTDPDLRDLRERATRELRTGKHALYLPAHIERQTAGPAARFYANLFGEAKDHVIMVSKDDATLKAAEGTGIHLIKEQDVLKLINWERAYELGLLPQEVNPYAGGEVKVAVYGAPSEDALQAGEFIRRTIDGTKGRTLIIADLYRRALRLTPENIFTADTDAKDHSKYLPVIMNMIPHILGPVHKNNIASFLAKTGDGRNNHPVFSEVNNMVNNSDPHLSMLGAILSSRSWYLTGEAYTTSRMWDENAVSLGYGAETFRNLWVANEILKDKSGTTVSSQIANPATKGELGDVPPLNDYVMTEWCAQQLDHAANYFLKYGATPADFYNPKNPDNLEHFKRWNTMHAGKFDIITVPHDLIPALQTLGNKPNVIVRRRREVLLPPVETWERLGLIDYNEVRKIKDYGLPI